MLIDTQVLLWFLAGNRKRVDGALRKRIEGGAPTVSVASFWEVAIKIGLGKLDAPEDLPERVEQFGFELLQVKAEHAWQVRYLPPHHRDPFDRLLIAQAQIERLRILTADPSFADYEMAVIWD